MRESELQNDIMRRLNEHPQVIWSFVTTVGKLKGRAGHWITLGYPGIADIVGQLRTSKSGRGTLFALEVKTEAGRLSDVQKDFIDTVVEAGGTAGVVRSVEDALELINNA